MFELTCYTDTLSGTCGVGVLYDFRGRKSDWDTPFRQQDIEGGTGFEIAGFIDNGICETSYKYLKSKFQIVFQSPVRLNTNSGNAFFFIVLDFNVPTTHVNNSTYSWPEFTEENNDGA